MKKWNLLWLATIILSSILLVTNSCQKEEQEQNILTSFNDKAEYFDKIVDIFNSTYQSSSFPSAVSQLMNELNENTAISSSGLTEDSISVWWRTQDNVLFLLHLKVLDSYVDSLDSDLIIKNQIINDKSTLQDIRLHNNKALLLSPSYYDWAPYAIPPSQEMKDINYYFKLKLESKNFVVDYFRNETSHQQNITLENYMSWDGYSIISFSGHGAVADNIFGITSGIRITPEFESQYSDKFLNNEFMWTGKAKDGNYKYVAITNLFFKIHYPNFLDNTFILMSACQSQMNSILALDLVKIGGNSVYWGWTNNMTPLAGAWRNTRFLIDQMVDFGITSGQTNSLMVENNRHRHILMPQIKYTYLEMPPHSSMDLRLIDNGVNSDFVDVDGQFQMSKYLVTNSQYISFLNDAYSKDLIYIQNDYVYGYFEGDKYEPEGYYKYYKLGKANGSYNYGQINYNYSDNTFYLDNAYGDNNDYSNHPVVMVTWYGSSGFANYYNLKLPSVEQWRIAAGNDEYSFGSGSYINRLNYKNSGDPWDNGTTPVGYYNGSNGTINSPGPYGVYDMNGNVWKFLSNRSDRWSDGFLRVASTGGCFLIDPDSPYGNSLTNNYWWHIGLGAYWETYGFICIKEY